MKISVIVPVFNTEKLISRCLDSILNQTYKNFEIVIVDDCSPDNAAQIAMEYASCHSNVKIIRHEKNRGLMVSRKTGYDNAKGDYYMFVDSDDTLPQEALSILATEAQKNQTPIVVAGHTTISSKGDVISENLPSLEGVYNSHEIFNFLLSRKIRHNLAFCLFSCKLFEKNYYTIENQTNGEDLILFYQLVKEADIISIIRKSVYNYYQNPGSSTNSGISHGLLKQLVNVINFIYDFLKDFGIPENRILKYILPNITKWYLTPGGKEIALGLRPAILNATNYKVASKLLPLQKALYISLSKHCPFLINSLRKFKRFITSLRN